MDTLKKYIKIIQNRIYFPFLLQGAINEFRKVRKNATTPAEAVSLSLDFAYGPKTRGLNINIIPAQIPKEIIKLVEKVKNEKPLTFLEIGTATGGTLFLWTQFLPDNATIISIDLPFGKFGAGYLSTKGKFYKSLAQRGQHLKLICGDSHSSAIKNKLKEILKEKKIDFMFIDGDHTYEGVKTDFYEYKDFVKTGGFIAFHDIFENINDKTFGTNKFWLEIKDQYKNEEYIEANREKNGSGIGVLQLPA